MTQDGDRVGRAHVFADPSIWIVMGAALLGRLPALGAWWCLDDWGQLARAAGNIPSPEAWPARVLSQHWWWSLTLPFLGLSGAAHASARLLLHGLAAVAVLRIGRKLGLVPGGSFLAALLFAATPLAFTPLYWASGIQELLAGVLALWAVERWLSRGGVAVVAATLLGALSMLAKEPGLGLPLLFLGTMVFRPRARRWRLASVFVLMGMAVWQARLVLGHFATGDQDAYSLGGVSLVLSNLGQYGVLLAWPWPLFPPKLVWPHAAWGFLLWGAWLIWSLVAWRRGQRWVSAAMVAALLSLGPALPLAQQTRPYMAYTAVAALTLVLGSLWPRTWPGGTGRRQEAVLALLAVGVSTGGMLIRLDSADPVVKATEDSRRAAMVLRQGQADHPEAAARGVTVFQQPLRPETVARADRLGPDALRTLPAHNALGGELGLRLFTPEGVAVHWTNSLTRPAPAPGLVLCETGGGLESWGPAGGAFLRAGMMDLVVGNHRRATAELMAASRFAQDGPVDLGPEFAALDLAELRGASTRFARWLGTAEGRQEVGDAERALIAGQVRRLLRQKGG